MKSAEEKIKDLQQKHREQMKANRDRVKARKTRTHRLIVRGAIAEKAIKGAETMTDEEFQDELYRRLGQHLMDLWNEPDDISDTDTLCENPR